MNYFFRGSCLLLLALITHSLRAQNETESNLKLEQYELARNGMTVEEQKSRLKTILSEAQEQNDYAAQANSYRKLGILHKNLGEFQTALNYFLMTSKLEENRGSFRAQGSTINNIAYIYYVIGDYGKAREYYQQAYELFKSARFPAGMADASINLAESSFKYGDTANAEIWSNKSFQHRIESKDSTDIGYNHEIASRLTLARRSMSQAKQEVRLAIKSYRNARDDNGLLNALILSGDIRIATDEPDSAIVFLKQALFEARRQSNKVAMRDAAFLMQKVYEEKGDPWQALEYHKTASMYNDSLLDESKVMALIDAEQLYQNESKTRELALQHKINRNRYILIIILLVLLITIGLVAFLILRNRLKNAKLAAKEIELRDHRIAEILKEQELNMVDAMMKGQEEERQRIAMDLHDRLGSMLATVKLHFSNIEEEVVQLEDKLARSYHVATDILNDACDEVRKISHDLYSGVLGNFGMKTALLKMIESVEAAKKISVSYIDNDLDRKIYQRFEVELYRITQELLGNTLKYAGAKEITIQLNKNEWQLVYSYEDDGKGFDAATLEEAKGIGFKNIDSRVKKMNGSWKLDTRPGHGMTLIIKIPLL